MNYLRGAVSAISAPYQYYKDINPSTLTGAIDVIVIQRPTDNGGTELVCSPFHVRFGKWQVMRPSDKQVNVFVNGNPIPFDMKIGEAGEAFFVFETEDDVPADLITSPVLHATVPTSESEDNEEDPVKGDRFGAKKNEEEQEEQAASKEVEREPDFLDLNEGVQQEQANNNLRTTPKQTHFVPRSLRRQDSKATISQFSLPSPPPSRDRSTERRESDEESPQMKEQDQRVDEALTVLKDQVHVPEVEYHEDVTLDMAGYKQSYHERDSSDQTIRSVSSSSTRKADEERFEFPRRSRSPSQPPPLPHVQSETSPYKPSPPSSPSSSQSGSPTTPHPLFRATSEPPPDVDDDSGPALTITASSQLPDMQAYSWEWGAFPQPSPLKASFGKGGRIEPPGPSERKGRLGGMTLPRGTSNLVQGTDTAGNIMDEWKEQAHGRSRSVPPALEGSPKKARRQFKEYEDFDDEEDTPRGRIKWQVNGQTPTQELEDALGLGGTLSSSRDDPSVFMLAIDGRNVAFELSLVSTEEAKTRRMNSFLDEVEIAHVFDQYKVDLTRFLDDDSVVQDPRLVIRWSAEQYIRRSDGSPLMDSLVHWRESTLKKRADGDALRPVSPPPADLDQPQQPPVGRNDAGDSKLPQKPQLPAKTPTSSSWVAWWRSSRTAENEKNIANGDVVTQQKAEKPSTSLQRPRLEDMKKSHTVDALSEPSTPLQRPEDDVHVPSKAPQTSQPSPSTKYAKTLRLTSDQLKSLNLKPGPNSITFSLSASGAVAATARIFVWDSTDLVVVSDIDGTITKSDGLGHVFAMIGRDWTHMGVAKLYTDIVRNGYKIMYLTSRAIGQADATRDYLKGIKQNNYQLPEGPVIMSPDRLMASLHREVIMRKPEVFKMSCLRDIQRLFGESHRNPFYAGFGNRITDALSYRTVNVPSARIFTIDSTGEVKMELLELAGYKSSYIHMTDLVDQMFPPIHRKWAPEFTDFNYWKASVQEYPLPDLSPPSPALSARSDTSNQSALARLRNFSLASGRSQSINKQALAAVNDTIRNEAAGTAESYRSSHLRQMSSFEKLGSTLGFIGRGDDSFRRSVSPSSSSSYLDSDDEDDGELDLEGKRRRQRRRSMTTMPGTLDETHFDLDDEDEHAQQGDDHFVHGEEEDEDGDGYEVDDDENHIDAEEEAEAAFNDDLLAAGEMENVPFL